MAGAIHIRSIPFEPDRGAVFKRLHVRPNSPDALELGAMLDEAVKIANPSAFYRPARVEKRLDETLTISGVQFHSRVLRVNLEQDEWVFPFVATCGMALQEWAAGQMDMMRQFWAEAIKEEALLAASAALFLEVERRERLGHFSTMSPGSLESWPISQQGPLFELLGDAATESGVRLTDSMLMVPTKSVSGLIFQTDDSFESCMLCQRDQCVNRRAPYDETLFEHKYCPAIG